MGLFDSINSNSAKYNPTDPRSSYDPLHYVGTGFQKMWDWGKERSTAPQMPDNPYQSQWGGLIDQLRQTANGQGESLAGDAFKQASDEGLRQQMTMAHGGSPGAARQAGINMGNINQGQAFGYSNARLQEQLAARQQLQQALTNAGNAWFQPQQQNLQAQLQSPTNMQMLTNFLGQIFSAGGTVAGGK